MDMYTYMIYVFRENIILLGLLFLTLIKNLYKYPPTRIYFIAIWNLSKLRQYCRKTRKNIKGLTNIMLPIKSEIAFKMTGVPSDYLKNQGISVMHKCA